jgi:hypothetical protein
MGDIRSFFENEVKKNKWEIFNHLFIRKAIDAAFDKGANEREICSNLL